MSIQYIFTVIETNNVKGLNKDNLIVFIEKESYLENKYLNDKKFEIIKIEKINFIYKETISLN